MWYDTNTNTVYSTEHDVRSAFPDISFAADFSDEQAAVVGLIPLVDGAKPDTTPYVNTIEPGEVTVSGGVAVRSWVLRPLNPQEVDTQKQATLLRAKMSRASLVDAITVTTASGKVFDGNEDAQNRMSRAINGMDDTDTIPWVLNDNTVAVVGKAELREALRLSGAAMTAIWVTPYTLQP